MKLEGSFPVLPTAQQLLIVHTLTPHFFQIHHNIILPPIPRSSKTFPFFQIFWLKSLLGFVISPLVDSC